MVKKPNQATKAADIKKQLEGLVGHEIDVSAEQLIKLFFPLGSYAFLGTDEGATSTWKSIFLPNINCTPTTFIDASGVSSTGVDGKRVFLLSDFVCDFFDFGEPINVVATPRAENPSFLTTTYSLVPPQATRPITDVQITVFAWHANAAAAPNVVFDWRCRAVATAHPI